MTTIRVADLTVDELRTLIRETVADLKLRPEIETYLGEYVRKNRNP